MRKRHLLGAALLILAAACAKYMIVPPAINLLDYGDIGLVTFRVENAKGELDAIGTQLFLQEVQRTQRVPIVEFGKFDEVLARIGKSTFDLEAAKAIGEQYGVHAFFMGDIKISKVKPQVDLIGALGDGVAMRAKFDIFVTGRLISTETGATLWTESTERQGTVGLFSMGPDQVPYFGLSDKNEAMNNLLREIMYRLTWDFRPTRQRI
jgi:hypothetical protein